VSTPLNFGTAGFSPALIAGYFTDGKNIENGNQIYDGVEVDGRGRAVAYHIRNTYPGQITAPLTEWKRVEIYGRKTESPNILQVMNSERPDQYRGVPYLSPVIEILLQLRRYTESELVAAVIQSFYTAFIRTTTDSTMIPINEVGAGDVAPPDGISGSLLRHPDGISRSENEYEMGPGTTIHLQPGEDVTLGSPNIPTAGFEVFVRTVAKLIGAALEIPFDVLIKEFNSSYSAARGALMEAWDAFKMRRTWFVDDFCQPLYELWLSEAVALGRVKAPGFFEDPRIRAAWCGARWIGPVQTQLDPTKEAKAAIMNVDRGFKTHEQVTVEQGGGDWNDNVAQLAIENAQLLAAGGGKYMATLEGDQGDGGLPDE
jgi:lambda family phage portal protein